MLIARHEQERVRLEEKMRNGLEEWVVSEKKMQSDIEEFERKIKVERKRRMRGLAQEEERMIAEMSQTAEKLSEVDRKILIDNQEAKLKQMAQDEEI